MNRRFCVALIALAMIAICASPALAGIVVNVKAVSAGANVVISDAGKTVTAKPGSVGSIVGLEVWATVSGTNTNVTDDGIQTLYSGIVQAGVDAGDAVKGKLTGYAYSSTFNTLSLDAVNVSDNLVGNKSPAAASGGKYLEYRASALQMNTVGGQSYLLGTISYEITAAALGAPAVIDATLNWANPLSNLAVASFKIDGTVKNGTAQSLLTMGSAVNITHQPIPEPSTLILLGMGALALLAIRRRK